MSEAMIINGLRKANSLGFYSDSNEGDGEPDATAQILEQRIGQYLYLPELFCYGFFVPLCIFLG